MPSYARTITDNRCSGSYCSHESHAGVTGLHDRGLKTKEMEKGKGRFSFNRNQDVEIVVKPHRDAGNAAALQVF